MAEADELKKRGYKIEHVLRLLQLETQIFEAASEIRSSQARCNEILDDEDGPVAKELLCAEITERLAVLRSELEVTKDDIKTSRRLIAERTEAFHRRRARLDIVKRGLIEQRQSYQDLQNRLVQLSRQSLSVQAKAYSQRVHLLQQLEFIYPIELLDGATLMFSINGVPLPNRGVDEDKKGKTSQIEDDQVSSALGYVGQVLALMSVYLNTPIPYPIATVGSRSIIQDTISVMSGPRAFPLYAKGVEQYRFEYAIFLLNKDIEQLMNHFGITVLDIRNTLPNLKNLLVTLSASLESTSRLSRKNMIGHQMISLQATRSSGEKADAGRIGLGLPQATTAVD